MDNSIETQAPADTDSAFNSIFMKMAETHPDYESEQLELNEEPKAAPKAKAKPQPTQEPESEDPEVEEAEDEQHDDVAESDEEDEEGEDDEQAEETPEIDFDEMEFTVKVQGQDETVKGHELLQGYMRQRDYSKKTAELATQRKEQEQIINTEKAKLSEDAKIYRFTALEQLNEFDNVLQAEGGWNAIQQKYAPDHVQQFKLMYEDAQIKAKQAGAYVQRYKQAKNAQRDAAVQDQVQNMFNTIPGLTQKTFEDLDDYVNTLGYSDSCESIQDPAIWPLIYKAMMYDKASAKATTKPTKATTKANKAVSAPTSKKTVNKTADTLKQMRTASINDNRALADKAITDIFKRIKRDE